MAASNSTKKDSGARSALGHISVVNTATPTESGTAITSARREDTSVPKMKGRAPNFSLTGFQSLPAKNFKPKACQESADRVTNSKTIRISTPRIASAQAVIAALKVKSGISPAERCKRGDARCLVPVSVVG